MPAPAAPIDPATVIDLVRDCVDQTFRDHGARMRATLIRMVGDFELAEDALQDALVAAVEKWPDSGIPDNPAGWIMKTARWRGIDRIRRATNLRNKQAAMFHHSETEPAEYDLAAEGPAIEDDRLRLIFTCCHPALSLESQVALTLRTVGGLKTEEIADAFLVPSATMGQRISRAKRKIRDAGIPYIVPEGDQLPERLAAVLAVIYLVFNEGYSRPAGTGTAGPELVDEAAKLAYLTTDLLPDEPEPLGLLSLILLLEARRAARFDDVGEAVLLKDQDRSNWNRVGIQRGLSILERALAFRHPGVYQIQAAIAAVHSQAESIDETDWAQIALLYDRLYQFSPSPVIRLNHAVAIAEASGAGAGLQMLDEIDAAGYLGEYAPYHIARSELLLRLDRQADAYTALIAAREASRSELDQANVARRLQEFPNRL